MEIKIKGGGRSFKINFTIRPQENNKGLYAMAKTSQDLNDLQEFLINRGVNDSAIGTVLAKNIEKKLKLPIDVDYDYQGPGYGFQFDMYSIAKKLK